MKVKIKKPLNKRKSRGFSGIRKRICRFCADKNRVIDYKDVKLLEGFVRERGKIVSSRISGNCARHQRMVSEAIKKARFLALIPYVKV